MAKNKKTMPWTFLGFLSLHGFLSLVRRDASQVETSLGCIKTVISSHVA